MAWTNAFWKPRFACPHAMGALAVVAVSIATAALGQSPPAAAWKPPAGAITLPLWPATPPGTQDSVPGPEINATKPASRKVAGLSVQRLGNVSDPSLTFFPAAEGTNTSVAALVFPGGAYKILAMDLEGTSACHWLNRIGVNCVLVKYRVPASGPYPKYSAALDDAQRAMGLVREHASRWHIDPAKVGVLGFSAGGNLAAQLSTHFNHRNYQVVDAADRLPCRPAFAMLIYPAYLTLPDKNYQPAPGIDVTPNSPPTFLVQAENDPVHVENAVHYFLQLKAQKVPAELHVYAAGGHGFGLRQTTLPITHWPKLAAIWLRTIGMTLKMHNPDTSR